ncbi:MAG: hypothetical protein MI802_09055, partial [Desulfobacterales bacterium]|nr:hypothetical protein [Desulfobacterales bacterium]
VEPVDLTEFVDPRAKRVVSVHGQTSLDYGKGVMTIDTPRAQGAVGFLGDAGVIELGDVTIRCGNEYATVVLVSLDDRPIAESKRVLVQTMTVDRPYGYRERNGEIVSVGSAPIGVEKIAVALRLEGEAWAGASVTALDEHGYATDRAVSIQRPGDGRVTLIALEPDAVYHVITRP